MANRAYKTAIVDLDIVSPYFRTREVQQILVERDIKVVASSVKGALLDVPAVSPEVFTILQDKSYQAIMDIGGDKAGARILGRYHDYLDIEPYEMFYVLNANRPMTNTVDSAVQNLRAIEEGLGQKFTSLVNNTHLCGLTTFEDILRGQVLCEKVTEKIGLPITYTVVHKNFTAKMMGEIKNSIFPISIYIKNPWER